MRFAIALLGVFCCARLFALTTTLEKTERGYRVSWEMTESEITFTSLENAGRQFQQVVFPESIGLGKEGEPEIPVFRTWIAIPPDTRFRTRVIRQEEKIWNSILLNPKQPDRLESAPATPFRFRAHAYRRNRWQPQSMVELGNPSRLGPVTILPLTFRPIQYHPKQRELRALLKGEIELVMKERGELPLLSRNAGLSSFHRQQLQHLTLNASEVAEQAAYTAATPSLLIVTDTELLPYVQRIAEIHVRRGIPVEFLEIAPGITATNLRDQIKARFESAKIDSVLLFGDEKRIPLYSYSSTPGDVFYSLLAGNDSIADIRIGRVPASNKSEALLYVDKRSYYASHQESGVKNRKVMLVAHKESYPGKYTGNLESIRKATNPRQLEFDPQYGGASATNQTVLAQVPNNFAIINYRGHGSSTTWSGWGKDSKSFGFSQVEAMNNDPLNLPIILNIACDTGAIQNSADSLAEKMLFSTSNEPYEGAIAVVAASQPSLTEVNHRFNAHLFKFMQESEDLTLGNIYALANNKLVQENGGSMPSNVKMYMLFADPLLGIPF